MWTRILTALVLAPLVVAGAWFAPDTVGAGLAVVATALAAWEYLALFSLRESRVLHVAGTAWITMGPLLAFVPGPLLLAWLFCSPLFALGLYLKVPDRIPKALSEAPALGMGVLYVGLLMASVVLLARLPEWGRSGLIMLFAVVWLGDSGAYFGGKLLGRHKLHPLVSPKKTLEGSFFGLLASVGGAFLIHHVCGSPLSVPMLLAAGIGGGMAEQVGDLCESVLKRSAGVKDSGALLPGHGGMLDRIDGLLFAAPVVYGLYLIALKGGAI
ncbi:MAG: hypothetical protein FJ109_15895 [Deltaproteobacteria bacterium]|nr:hypothetical protein [Deltaproteobacteria bacterium]